MAFISKDRESTGEDATIPPSFMTYHDEDPFASVMESTSALHCPDAKRNLLDDLNRAENTLLPAPSEKEAVAVFLRVKPRTSHERAIMKENWGEQGEKEDEEVVRVETEHQVALLAPKESQAFKNSMNGVGKMTHRYSFSKIFQPSCGQAKVFGEVVAPKVKDFLEGQNQLLFTYGATSAGKTYTIQGVPGDSGIMPRAVDVIFNTVGDRISPQLPLQPLGFNRVLAIGPSELEALAKEKDAVYRLGLELRAVTGRISPDISTLSGVSTASTASTASLNSLSSSDAMLDLSRLSQLFPGLAARDKDATKLDIRNSNILYSVWISFAEIYNENIHDLFRKVPMNKKKRPTMKLCEDRSGNTYVKGLREVRVNSADEAYQALMIGRENLHFAATKLNQQSSRSHCIFTIKLVKVADPSLPHLARVSMLSFCDLAGSERISKTHNVGERLKEAGNINTSLLVLGRCIKAIRHNQGLKEKEKKADQVVPFRESKLTRLFKSFFTGLGRSSLIVCISQAQYLFDESVHVCKFASIASKVTVETVKEAPPPKKQKKATRFSTMLAGRSRMMSLGGNSTVVGQTTMAWEPRKSSLLPAFSSFAPNARSTMVPLPLLDEGDDTVEEPLEETVVQTQYESLLTLVEDLKKKLIEERKKNTVLERDLRSELCEEFNAMLVEVEGNWEARLREEKEEAERLAEWRLGELQKVHVNKNKRKRGEDDDDDMGGELDAFRLEQKLEALEKERCNLKEEVEEGRNQMQAMKETTMKSKEAQEKLQTANSKLQFEMAESSRVAAERLNEVMKMKTLLEERKEEGDEAVAVAAVKVELAKKEEEVADLKQLLEEASVEFLEKEEEMKKLEGEVAVREHLVTNLQLSLTDLQSQLEESHLMLGGANDRLEEREARLEEVEADLEAGQSKLGELRRRIGELEGESRVGGEKQVALEALNKELKQLVDKEEKKAAVEEGRAKQAEEKMLAAQEERRTLLAEKAALVAEVAALKEGGASSNTIIEDFGSGLEVVDLKERVEKLEGELQGERELLKEQKVKAEEARAQASILQCQLDEMRGATSVDDSALMEEEVATLREEFEEEKKEKSHLKSKLEEAEKQVNMLEKIKKKLESEEFEHQEKLIEVESEKEEQVKLVEQLKQEVSVTSEKLKKAEDELARQASELSALNIQLKAEVKELENELGRMKTESGAELKETQEQLNSLKEDLEKTIQSKCKVEKEMKETANLLASAVEKEKKLQADLEVERKSKASAIAQQEVKMQKTTSTSNVKLVEVEVRADSLEKELYEKNLYVKELEDIIVEKETRIIELEGAESKEKELEATLESKKKVEEELKNISYKLEEEKKDKKEVENELSNMEAELLKVDATRQKLVNQLAEVEGKLAHQDEVKRQRNDLERRTNELMVTSSRLEGLEQELQASKEELKSMEERLGVETGKTKLAEEKLAAEVSKTAKLKGELTEAKDEMKMNKVATKKSAKDALEVEGVKERAAELEKEVTRLKSLAEAHEREGVALEILRTELQCKTNEIAALMKKNEILSSDFKANEYELEKTKQERTRLMAHYETKFKGMQNDLDKERSRKTEVGKLQEAMARATPTKATNELKEKLRREEEKVLELRAELVTLQKQADERNALHEREVKRAKQASDRTADMYREQNVVLQRQWRDEGARTGASSNEVSTLEADDSRTGEDSFVGGTPVVQKKTRGRGRGKTTKLGNRTTSNASLASYEDTENEGEVTGRPRANTLARKGRVTRRSKVEVNLEEDQLEKEVEKKPAASRKRGGASSKEALKERQVSALSPVVEGLNKANSRFTTSSTSNILAQFRDSDSAAFLTPALKKKRKLYSTTPQTSAVSSSNAEQEERSSNAQQVEVFTPPTPTSDSQVATPRSIVKRQLRTRKPPKC